MNQEDTRNAPWQNTRAHLSDAQEVIWALFCDNPLGSASMTPENSKTRALQVNQLTYLNTARTASFRL